MKKLLIPITLLLCMVGCRTVNAPTPPTAPAPGYNDSTDQRMGSILEAANNFYHSIQCQTQTMDWSAPAKSCLPSTKVTTPMVLGPTEKQSYNAFAVSLNVANAVYVDYHNGTATQAEAQAAINKVQSQQTALAASVQVVK